MIIVKHQVFAQQCKKRRVPAWPLFVRFVKWHFPSSKTSMCCWYETLLLMTKKEKRFVPSPETFPVFSFKLYSDTKMETRNVIKWSVLSWISASNWSSFTCLLPLLLVLFFFLSTYVISFCYWCWFFFVPALRSKLIRAKVDQVNKKVVIR